VQLLFAFSGEWLLSVFCLFFFRFGPTPVRAIVLQSCSLNIKRLSRHVDNPPLPLSAPPQLMGRGWKRWFSASVYLWHHEYPICTRVVSSPVVLVRLQPRILVHSEFFALHRYVTTPPLPVRRRFCYSPPSVLCSFASVQIVSLLATSFFLRTSYCLRGMSSISDVS